MFPQMKAETLGDLLLADRQQERRTRRFEECRHPSAVLPSDRDVAPRAESRLSAFLEESVALREQSERIMKEARELRLRIRQVWKETDEILRRVRKRDER